MRVGARRDREWPHSEREATVSGSNVVFGSANPEEGEVSLGCLPLLSLGGLQSGRGLPHSMTLRAVPSLAAKLRQVLDCASPLAFSGPIPPLARSPPIIVKQGLSP